MGVGLRAGLFLNLALMRLLVQQLVAFLIERFQGGEGRRQSLDVRVAFLYPHAHRLALGFQLVQLPILGAPLVGLIGGFLLRSTQLALFR